MQPGVLAVLAAVSVLGVAVLSGNIMLSGPSPMGMMGGGMMGGCNLDRMADSRTDTMDIDATRCQAMMQGTTETDHQRCQAMAGEMSMIHKPCHAIMDQG